MVQNAAASVQDAEDFFGRALSVCLDFLKGYDVYPCPRPSVPQNRHDACWQVMDRIETGDRKTTPVQHGFHANHVAGKNAGWEQDFTMNAIAFRNNLTQLLLDAREVRYTDSYEEEVEVYSETVPSPDEIRRRCLEIQKEWTPRERLKRAGKSVRDTSWTPPVVSVCEMDL